MPFAGCTSCASQCSADLDASAGATAAGAARRVRDGGRHHAGSVRGGARRARPARRGRRRNARSCASSTTRSGWTSLRARSWGSSAAACRLSRSCSLFAVTGGGRRTAVPRPADPDDQRARGGGRPGAAHGRRARSAGRAGARPDRGGDPWEPVDAARAAGRMSRAELAGGFGMPRTTTCSRAARGVLHAAHTSAAGADAATVSAGGGRPHRRRDAAVARGADAGVCRERGRRGGHRNGCSTSALGCGSAIRSCASAAYAAGTAEDRCAAHLALAEATDPAPNRERRVWHRAAAATRTGRSRRRGARADGGRGSGARRGGGRGCVPRAFGAVDRRAAATCRAGPRRGAGSPARRRVRFGSRPARRGPRARDRRRAARPDRAAQGTDPVRVRPRTRSAGPPACRPPRRLSRSTPRSRARRI